MHTPAATAQAAKLGVAERRLAHPGAAVLWALAGLTALGAALRFASLGLQSYHHDEAITAGRVLAGSFGDMLRQVRVSESNPPLYYALAWAWAKAFGTGEAGLRSLSALFGSATVPLAYLAARELATRRAGLIAAALVAVNPMLIWYSQEARSYAVLVFFAALSLVFFARSLHTRQSRDLAAWAISSALALCSHYFAVFAVAIEVLWLLVALRGEWRRAVAAVAAVAAVGAALLPLLAAQVNPTHIGWIDQTSLGARLWQTGVSFLAGETGHVIAEPPRERFALMPAVAIGLALLLLAARGSARERRGAGIALVLGLTVVALAGAAALLGHDYVVERNLLPALLPLAAVAAIGLGAARAWRLGSLVAVALCAYWLAFDVHVTRTPNLQRPDFRTLAERIGQPRAPRAIVTWKLAADPLVFYLADGAQRVYSGGHAVRAVDVVSKPHVREAPVLLPPSFRLAERLRLDRLTLMRYVSRRPRALRFNHLQDLPTGFGANAVLIDGLPSQSALPRRVGLSGGPQAVLRPGALGGRELADLRQDRRRDSGEVRR